MTAYKFVKKINFYSGVVYEWNIPTGHSCPFAKECKISVDEKTGKFSSHIGSYRCYASSAERFPGVRLLRWKNYNYVKNGGVPVIPIDCKHLRIHSSGDFFSQEYFDMWVSVAKNNPSVEMWAYTKSLRYWVKRIHEIPENLTLTASLGGLEDELVSKYNLRHTRVYNDIDLVPKNMPIDTNDDIARQKNINFALLNNSKYSKKNHY